MKTNSFRTIQLSKQEVFEAISDFFAKKSKPLTSSEKITSVRSVEKEEYSGEECGGSGPIYSFEGLQVTVRGE
jgi:hypothetical protein